MNTVSSPATSDSRNRPLDADRERDRGRFRRSASLRLGFIAAGAVLIALVVTGLAYLAGTHLIAAWWLENHHGVVAWDFDETNWRQGGATSVSFASRHSMSSLNDGDLDHLLKLRHVVSLNLAECDRITDNGMALLQRLDGLTELNLDRLNRYRQAQFGVTSAPLTDACLVHLLALRRLENLSLAGNLITDRGLAQISTMTNLKSLDLSATEVSDAGLAYIEGMKSLERISLESSRVTNEGLAHLRAARPNLTIEIFLEPAVAEGVVLVRGKTQ